MSDPVPEREPRTTIRTSDEDRDKAAEVLADAVATGRISGAEHEARLDALFAAKTQDQLDAVISDLPARPERRSGLYRSIDPYRCVVVGGRARRVGRFRIGRFSSVIVLFGDLELDLRSARHSQDEIAITLWSLASRVTITIPVGWRLRNRVLSLGNRLSPPDNEHDPGAVLLDVRGVSVGRRYSISQG